MIARHLSAFCVCIWEVGEEKSLVDMWVCVHSLDRWMDGVFEV
jgi:hypothetical protein